MLYRKYVPRYLSELEDRLGNFLKTNPDEPGHDFSILTSSGGI